MKDTNKETAVQNEQQTNKSIREIKDKIIKNLAKNNLSIAEVEKILCDVSQEFKKQPSILRYDYENHHCVYDVFILTGYYDLSNKLERIITLLEGMQPQTQTYPYRSSFGGYRSTF